MTKQDILIRTYPNSRNKFSFDGWPVVDTESSVEVNLPNRERVLSIAFKSNGVEVNYWSGNSDNLWEKLDTKLFKS